MTKVRIVRVGSSGEDYLVLRDGDLVLRVNFDDDWMMTKEEWAASFSVFEGKHVVIPVEGPFFIGTDFVCGDVDGVARVIPAYVPVTSIDRL
jgi:hypothetical protein